MMAESNGWRIGDMAENKQLISTPALLMRDGALASETRQIAAPKTPPSLESECDRTITCWTASGSLIRILIEFAGDAGCAGHTRAGPHM
jgi:hypothetical protein